MKAMLAASACGGRAVEDGVAGQVVADSGGRSTHLAAEVEERIGPVTRMLFVLRH